MDGVRIFDSVTDELFSRSYFLNLFSLFCPVFLPVLINNIVIAIKEIKC